jgi:hypothetical protein
MANVNGTEINLMPTAGMREEAVARPRGMGGMGRRCWPEVVYIQSR